jgi:hypothetical protein
MVLLLALLLALLMACTNTNDVQSVPHANFEANLAPNLSTQ